MADGTAFNRSAVTSASLADARSAARRVSAMGWQGPNPGTSDDEVCYTRRYMSTTILIVGIILLLTTLIGGLVLLMRSEDRITLRVVDGSDGRRVIASGTADPAMSAALSAMFDALPAPAAQAPATTAPVEGETKSCPHCAETIKAAAVKCRFCGSELAAA